MGIQGGGLEKVWIIAKQFGAPMRGSYFFYILTLVLVTLTKKFKELYYVIPFIPLILFATTPFNWPKATYYSLWLYVYMTPFIFCYLTYLF